MKGSWLRLAQVGIVALAMEPVERGEWSPADADILFVSTRDGNADLVLLDSKAGTQNTLRAEGRSWYPRFSPDGRYLSFSEPAAGGYENEDLDVLVLPVAGGDPRLLVGGPGRESEASWRPLR